MRCFTKVNKVNLLISWSHGVKPPSKSTGDRATRCNIGHCHVDFGPVSSVVVLGLCHFPFETGMCAFLIFEKSRPDYNSEFLRPSIFPCTPQATKSVEFTLSGY